MFEHWNRLFGVEIPVAIAAPLLVSACSFFGALAVRFARFSVERARAYFDQIVIEWPLDLRWLQEELAELGLESIPIYCLVVRFGTDEYLRDMASDQERYEGRLRNRVIAVEPGSEVVSLPLHKRLGTQFKLYMAAPDPRTARSIYNRLKQARVARKDRTSVGERELEVVLLEADGAKHKLILRPRAEPPQEIDDVTVGEPNHQIILDPSEPGDHRLWFRLAAVGSTTSVDGYCNNIAGATLLSDFERRHGWRPFAALRKGQAPRRRNA